MSPLLLAAVAASVATAAERPKFVAFAWEFSGNTPQSLLRIVDKFDQTPLDGIGLWLKASTVVNGVVTNFNHRRFMHEPAWPREAFTNQIPHFRELTKHRSMRHSFVKSLSCPRTRIPWTADAEWARIAGSMRTVAWVAREGG
ncbi:MAG: hypothetical protein IJG13_00235, partial [Kiritimatiellae bacterium]|nr:hypothetical protein [Kiritimatiellia bacterium]